jgi:DeoR/GlpR family transcriptional regulator of sugar metabolism
VLDEIQRRGGASLSELARLLGVSDMTIRRDVTFLEHEGLIERVYGGAMPVRRGSDLSIPVEEGTAQYAEKASIAEAAAKMVKPGMSIGITGGTTAVVLARRLAKIGGMTVVTNSMKVWNEIHASGSWDAPVVITGGEFRTSSETFVGPTANAAIRSVYLDVLLLGVYGMDDVAGFTNTDISEAETNRTFISRARRVVVLADHTKWRVTGLCTIAQLSDVDAVITDDGYDLADLQVLEAHVKDLRVSSIARAQDERESLAS